MNNPESHSNEARQPDDFWRPRTLDEVAAEQNVTQPQDLDELIGAAAGLWESDEEFERFVGLLRRGRTLPPPQPQEERGRPYAG